MSAQALCRADRRVFASVGSSRRARREVGVPACRVHFMEVAGASAAVSFTSDNFTSDDVTADGLDPLRWVTLRIRPSDRERPTHPRPI